MTSLSNSGPTLAFVLLAAGTTVGLAGTDLVLPAVPSLPTELGGGIASAQLVIAAFVAGTAAGLLLVGTLGSRLGRWRAIWIALLAYSTLSFMAGASSRIDVVIGLRFLQGVVACTSAVYAPSILRELFSESGATKALGVLGSIESVVPALAPAIGARLIARWSWRAPFFAISILAIVLAVAILSSGRVVLDTAVPARRRSSYLSMLRDRTFLRYALSQACVLGGLLLFVFGAPTVIVTVMHGTVRDFVWMQVAGISCFIVAATATGYLVGSVGAERMIWLGTVLAAVGATAIAIYAAQGDGNPRALIGLIVPLNVGLGLRGPPGFFRAILAGGGDDERAASLTILAAMVVAAASTAILAPILERGLLVLGGACALIEASAVVLLYFLPELRSDRGATSGTGV